MLNLNQKPRDYQCLFLDMNSFFAMVEQQIQPPLRGQSIGVAPYVGNTGCIIAASTEAKEFGVKCGVLVKQAKKLSPSINIMEARPAFYLLYHKAIKKILDQHSPFVQPLSIDEFLIELSADQQNKLSAVRLAKQIKQAITNQVGDYLTCSIGLSSNYFLAKLAGESQKPDGLTWLELKDLASFYSSLQLTDLPGINTQTKKRLHRLKITTPLELFNSTRSDLTKNLGVLGRSWYYRLRGYSLDQPKIKTKSIGHSHVLPPNLRTKDSAETIIKKLIQKAGYRIRKGGYTAQGIKVAVNFYNGPFFHQSKKVPPFSDSQTFQKQVLKLLTNCPWKGQPAYVAISAFNLVKQSKIQLNLLPEIEKSRQLSIALDKINDQFGANSIYPASTLKALEAAPDRIPFGRPRYEIRQ